MTAATRPRLRCDQSAIVSSIVPGGQQVPGGHGVVLADAVAAVLGLVVHRRRPLELEEGDVRGARERDALRRRRAWRRRAAAGRRGPGRRATVASRALERVAAEQVQRVREALEHRLLHLEVAGEDDERLARGEEVVDPGQRGVELAARGQPLQRAELGQALGAQRRGDLRRRALRGRAAARAATRSRSCSARRYSRSLSSATGTTTWRLAGSCGRTSAFSRRTKQRRRRCQCRRSSRQRPANWRAKRAPEPKSSMRPRTRSCGDQLLGVVEDRRAGQRQAQAVAWPRRRPAGGRPGCAWPAGS